MDYALRILRALHQDGQLSAAAVARQEHMQKAITLKLLNRLLSAGIVESRRGGNGYIRITRVQVDRETLLMHVINSLGDRVDLPSARAILGNLAEAGALKEDLARTLLAAVGDKALGAVPRDLRDQVRADVLKNVLILQV